MYTIFVVKVTQQEVNLTSLNNLTWDLVNFLIKLIYCFSNLHGKSSDFHTHMGDSYDSLPPPLFRHGGGGAWPLGPCPWVRPCAKPLIFWEEMAGKKGGNNIIFGVNMLCERRSATKARHFLEKFSSNTPIGQNVSKNLAISGIFCHI